MMIKRWHCAVVTMKPTLYTATGECVTPAVNWAKVAKARFMISRSLSMRRQDLSHAATRLKTGQTCLLAATADAQLLNYVAWPQATLTVDEAEKLSVL